MQFIRERPPTTYAVTLTIPEVEKIAEGAKDLAGIAFDDEREGWLKLHNRMRELAKRLKSYEGSE